MKKQLNQCHCAHFDEFRAEAEGYFTAIKKDANRTEERFNQQDKLLHQIVSKVDLILDIVGRLASSVSYHGARLSGYERRIAKLERQVS